jgi:hypothetical protein
MSQENDLLQKFIDNEKKSKQTTLMFVLIFVLAALGFLYLAYQLNIKTKENVELKLSNDYIQKINDSLHEVISNHYEMASNNLDHNNAVLRDQVKTLTEKLTSVESDLGKNNSANEISHIKKEIQQVTKSSKEITRPEKSYTVYIQHNSEDRQEAEQINKMRKKLSGFGYNVPSEEFVNRPIKQTYVCYFYDEDLNYAKEVLEKIKSIYGDATLMKKEMRAPKKQIEVWVNTK